MTTPDAQHRIILDFDDAETLRLALEHIGDPDAPVGLAGGQVITDGEVFELWDEYDAAMAATEDNHEQDPS